ncbi:MAG TPA: LysR substrate-binding domain-containing protein [Steroidobacteraceae bacterium]|nr:LysR substrate-binding domain-containing protein [Steroidobacteraceae bacterium]HRX89461.1 LysR substrate-binding domain-containing protein [Steroidobacteraceae bacterium]
MARETNLQQWRFALAVARNGLSVTHAAQILGVSQPAISRALKELEQILGFAVFVREGRALTRITPEGEQVLAAAQRAVNEFNGLTALARDVAGEESGSLSLATTHTQARYVLPPVVTAFRHRHPSVDLNLHQGTSEQIAEMVAADRVQLAIATGSEGLFAGMVLLPVYRWHRQVVVPRKHPLTRAGRLTLEKLAAFPLVTYVFSFSGASSLQQIFERAGLTPKIALTARDSDVIKTYVRLGLGVGIIASVAIDPREDHDLVVLDADHLFPIHTTWVGFRRGTRLREYTYDFLAAFGPHLTRRLIDRAAADPARIPDLFRRIALPVQ